jgi:shikimate dehydrogenase
MNDIFSLRNQKPEIGTKVYCILSDERVFQSRSPIIFSTVMQRVGLKGIYVPFMVKPERLGEAIHSLKVLNIAGANITAPYKEAVIPFLDTLSESANIIGAINTIARDGDRLKGYNTNAIGLMDTFESIGFDPTGKTALVFGSGGAARSAAFILNWLRTDTVFIAARNIQKAERLAEKLGGRAVSITELQEESISAHIIVNATSASAYHEAQGLDKALSLMDLSRCELLLDLNYGRSENFWKDVALSRDVRFIDGLSTLANQAKRTFALWTGIQVEPAEFLRAMDAGG